jgi:hypothetical protein
MFQRRDEVVGLVSRILFVTTISLGTYQAVVRSAHQLRPIWLAPSEVLAVSAFAPPSLVKQ